MAQRKPRRGKRKRPPQSPHVARAVAPEKRLTGLFELMDEITGRAHRGFQAGAGQPTDGPERVELAIFLRGLNGLKSARLLLGQAHWENASAVVRQIYELVLNVEHMASFDDRDDALFRFAKFGVLQATRSQLAHLEYDKSTGRAVDDARVRQLQRLLDHGFPEFRSERSSGATRWAANWSRKSVRELAKASPNSMREQQYRLLYSAWSEQVHGAPGAVLEGMPGHLPEDEWAEQLVSSDDVSIVEAGTHAISLFLELWLALPRAEAPGELCEIWARRTVELALEYGAPEPRTS